MENKAVFVVLINLTLCSCRYIPKNYQKDFRSIDRGAKDNGVINDINMKSGTYSCEETNNCENGIKIIPPKLPQLSDVAENDDFMWLSTPYEVNHYANSGTLGVGVGSHRGVLHPHVHPDVLAASHPFAPVMKLPAVYPRRWEHTPYYDTPIYEPTRAARLALPDLEDDILDELAQDAMMPNILPTMSIPMGRSYTAENRHGSIAVFPGQPSSCSIPILLSCTPNIAKGVLGAPVPEVKKEYRSTKVKLNDDKKKEGGHVAAVLPEALPADGVQ